MPADALPAPHRGQAASAPMGLLPGGATGFSLFFGAYVDPTFIGMKGTLTLSVPLVHVSTGDVLQRSWTVVIGADGTASVGDLPFNDDPAFTPTGSAYTLTWQALSYKPTPGDRTFQVHMADGATIDYDLLAASTAPGVLIPGGVTPANLDAMVAALLADPASQARAAALGLPTYPNGA